MNILFFIAIINLKNCTIAFIFIAKVNKKMAQPLVII